MKMSKLEKTFVNSPSHSKQVSHHAETLLKRIDFKAGQKYLDVGCGNGAAPIYLAQKYGLEITGIDVDPDQIKEAEKISADAHNVQFLTIDGTQLPFEDGQFDIIFTNKVMHHIPNWQDALIEMVRVLKPNGYLIYSDLVFPGWVAAIGKRVTKKCAGFPTSTALTGFMEDHKLAVVYLSKSPVQYEGVFQKQ